MQMMSNHPISAGHDPCMYLNAMGTYSTLPVQIKPWPQPAWCCSLYKLLQ